MKTKNPAFLLMIFVLTLISSLFVVSAEELNDISSLGSEVDLSDLITMGSSILATFLFVLSVIAYGRDGRKRFFYVSLAFLLFAIKGILISIDAFFPQKGVWADPLGTFLDFGILLSFFFGIVKRKG